MKPPFLKQKLCLIVPEIQNLMANFFSHRFKVRRDVVAAQVRSSMHNRSSIPDQYDLNLADTIESVKIIVFCWLRYQSPMEKRLVVGFGRKQAVSREKQ